MVGAAIGGTIGTAIVASLPYLVPVVDNFFQQKADMDRILSLLLCKVNALDDAMKKGVKPLDNCYALLLPKKIDK